MPAGRHADGQRRPGSVRTTRRRSSEIFDIQPARNVSQGGRRVHLRQQVEAALLHEARRRLLRLSGAVGRQEQALAAYYVEKGTDWWTEHYPADQMQRPTGPLCDGCHSVNYDIKTKTVTEWNVGCEKCHGAGSLHVAVPGRGDDRQSAPSSTPCAPTTCASSATRRASPGQPDRRCLLRLAGRLSAGRSSERRLDARGITSGKETFTHWPDGTRAQEPDAGQRLRPEPDVVKGVRCYGCHDVHGTEHRLICDSRAMRSACSATNPRCSPARLGTIEQHTQHKAGSEGSKCVACHMPAHRADGRRRQRAQPHVQVHLAGHDRRR